MRISAIGAYGWAMRHALQPLQRGRRVVHFGGLRSRAPWTTAKEVAVRSVAIGQHDVCRPAQFSLVDAGNGSMRAHLRNLIFRITLYIHTVLS